VSYVYRTGSGVVENGLLRRIWGTGQDMTDLVRAQEEIRQLNATLEEQVVQRTAELRATVEELKAFSHSVSHDLRAPLLGIAGCSRALIEDYSDRLEPGALDWVKLIQRDAEHLDRLLNSLLALSRITQAEIFTQPVDLTATAESVISGLRQSEPQRQVTAVIAQGMQATGDPALLRVVFENLIGNAWKFSRTRVEARIEVGVTTVNNQPTFYVRDNGVGFDQRYASRLFAAFQRLHSCDFDGTGIGLATVRRVIHRHGGRVWAEGAVDQGATFYFTLGRLEEFRA
jgi:signal transduction histidine kinase